MIRERIVISGLKVKTVIGAHEWEQQVPQTLVLDLAIGTHSFSRCANSDVLDQALDYQKVAEWIQLFGLNTSHKLLESFVTKMTDELDKAFSISSVKVLVKKYQAIPDTNFVGVEIERCFETPKL